MLDAPLGPSGHPAITPKWAHALAATMIVAWSLVAWMVLRQPFITADWAGWRETDTQSIARHLTEPGSSLLYPRINWGGDGPGYVETEMQLYPALVALFLRALGDAEWPGQLISAASIAFAAWVLYRSLRDVHGERAALSGLGAFLVAPVLSFIGTSVQPEALCLLLFVIAWSYFLRYEARGKATDLAFYALFGALAMLVKPTAAQLGVASFVVLFLRSREHLRRAPIWIAWIFMVGALGAFLWHAHGLYERYHNTFGVLSGGDSKLPKLRQLKMLGTYRLAATTVSVWGLGIVGTLSLVIVVIRRCANAPIWGLLAANVVWTFVALRYVCNVSWGGLHYTIVSAVLAAHAAAALAHALERVGRTRRAVVALSSAAFLGAALFTVVSRFRARGPNDEARQVIAVARKLSELVRPNDLVVVRSSRWAHDSFWNTPSNFEDPRVFYLANTRGFIVGRDHTDPLMIEAFARRGARYYVEPGPDFVAVPIDGWLEHHAKLVATTTLGGRIFELEGPS